MHITETIQTLKPHLTGDHLVLDLGTTGYFHLYLIVERVASSLEDSDETTRKATQDTEWWKRIHTPNELDPKWGAGSLAVLQEYLDTTLLEIQQRAESASNALTSIGMPKMVMETLVCDTRTWNAVYKNRPSGLQAAGLAFYNTHGIGVNIPALLDASTNVLTHEWAHWYMRQMSKTQKTNIKTWFDLQINPKKKALEYEPLSPQQVRGVIQDMFDQWCTKYVQTSFEDWVDTLRKYWPEREKIMYDNPPEDIKTEEQQKETIRLFRSGCALIGYSKKPFLAASLQSQPKKIRAGAVVWTVQHSHLGQSYFNIQIGEPSGEGPRIGQFTAQVLEPDSKYQALNFDLESDLDDMMSINFKKTLQYANTVGRLDPVTKLIVKVNTGMLSAPTVVVDHLRLMFNMTHAITEDTFHEMWGSKASWFNTMFSVTLGDNIRTTSDVDWESEGNDIAETLGKMKDEDLTAEAILDTCVKVWQKKLVLVNNDDVIRAKLSWKGDTPTAYGATNANEFFAELIAQVAEQGVNSLSTQMKKWWYDFQKGAFTEQHLRESITDIDTEYMKAVEEQDTKRCQTLVLKAAKAAGYTIGPVTHGTRAKFTRFDPTKTGRTGQPDTKEGSAFFFTTDKITAAMVANAGEPEIGKSGLPPSFSLMQVMLHLTNPITYDPNRWGDPDNIDTHRMARMIQMAKEQGRDGVLYKSKAMGDTYVVFEPAQIKSASPITYDEEGNVIPLSQRFNPAKKDIREQTDPESDANQAIGTVSVVKKDIKDLEPPFAPKRSYDVVFTIDEADPEQIKAFRKWASSKIRKYLPQLDAPNYLDHAGIGKFKAYWFVMLADPHPDLDEVLAALQQMYTDFLQLPPPPEKKLRVQKTYDPEGNEITPLPDLDPLVLETLTTDIEPYLQQVFEQVVERKVANWQKYVEWADAQPEVKVSEKNPRTGRYYGYAGKLDYWEYLVREVYHGKEPQDYRSPYARYGYQTVDEMRPRFEREVRQMIDSTRDHFLDAVWKFLPRQDVPATKVQHTRLELDGGVLIGVWEVTYEDGSRKQLDTQLIWAGGYNIQRLHTRYLVHVRNLTESQSSLSETTGRDMMKQSIKETSTTDTDVIGRTWDSQHGVRKVVGVVTIGGKSRVKIQTSDNPLHDLLPLDQLEREIELDASRLHRNTSSNDTDQGPVKDTEVERFVSTMTPRDAAKARNVLSRSLTSDGTLYTLAGLVKQKISQGYRVQGDRLLNPATRVFLTVKELGKTAMAFATFLSTQTEDIVRKASTQTSLKESPQYDKRVMRELIRKDSLLRMFAKDQPPEILFKTLVVGDSAMEKAYYQVAQTLGINWGGDTTFESVLRENLGPDMESILAAHDIHSVRDAFEWALDDRSHGDDFLADAAKEIAQDYYGTQISDDLSAAHSEEEAAAYLRIVFHRADEMRNQLEQHTEFTLPTWELRFDHLTEAQIDRLYPCLTLLEQRGTLRLPNLGTLIHLENVTIIESSSALSFRLRTCSEQVAKWVHDMIQTLLGE